MKTINAEDFGAYCDALTAVVVNAPLPDAMKACHEIGMEESTKAFVAKVGPDGTPWPERKVEGDGHPLMILTGSLGQAATGGPGHAVVLADRSMGYGVDLDAPRLGVPQTPWKHSLPNPKSADDTLTYARALNFGYPENNLPPRPFLGLGDDAKDRCGHIIMDDLSELIVAIP